MRFPTIFRRDKTTTKNKALFSDANPQTGGLSNGALKIQDNFFSYRLTSINGWPIQRIAVCLATSPAGAVAINGQLFFYEEQSNAWVVAAAAKALAPGVITWFDLAVMSDNVNTQGGMSGPGGIDGYLYLSTVAGADPDGTYTLIAGPDSSNTT